MGLWKRIRDSRHEARKRREQARAERRSRDRGAKEEAYSDDPDRDDAGRQPYVNPF